MIRIHNMRTEIKENIDYYKLVSKKLRINSNNIHSLKIHKRSIDARNKKLFSYVFDIDVVVDNEKRYLGKDVELVLNEEYIVPQMGTEKLNNRPVIVGAGPAGLFCAYELAKYGYKPIIIERGEKIEDRILTVEKSWQENKFNENSNVQFGEGGAGTFSDGKLNTLVSDKANRMKEVFEIFVRCGAPKEIMYDFRPHIGTDVLREVVINLRNEIISMGGSFYYNSLLEDVIIENNCVKQIIINNKVIDTNILILAIGHSARDTFKLLKQKGFAMESKPFAVGIRIMHPQKMIDLNQYPINYPFLPPSSYKLTYKSKSGKGVYSFCMCPGGYVVDARSSKNTVVVNGMSNYQRDSEVANSAIVVTVDKSDYGDDLFAGMHFQEKLESLAYDIAHGNIPVQKYVDYKNNIISSNLENLKIKGNYKCANINDIFPSKINDTLKEGIDYFASKINGFNDESAIIAAPETRTSSPIRIIRSDTLESSILGVYPIGEGAGYAGGITTSAMDGLKAFEEIRKKYHNFL